MLYKVKIHWKKPYEIATSQICCRSYTANHGMSLRPWKKTWHFSSSEEELKAMDATDKTKVIEDEPGKKKSKLHLLKDKVRLEETPWLVVSNMNMFSISYMGYFFVPLTNSYFSRWFLHHQPAHDLPFQGPKCERYMSYIVIHKA